MSEKNTNFINIVLYAPEIPQNTGNIARFCAANDLKLHLIEPLGFEINDKYLKRAAMDYWKHLDFEVYASWDKFLELNPWITSSPSAPRDDSSSVIVSENNVIASEAQQSTSENNVIASEARQSTSDNNVIASEAQQSTSDNNVIASEARQSTSGSNMWFLSSKTDKSYWDVTYQEGDYLVFGNEGSGLPKDFYQTYKDQLITIPMTSDKIRCLNLASSAQTAYYEAFRQLNLN